MLDRRWQWAYTAVYWLEYRLGQLRKWIVRHFGD